MSFVTDRLECRTGVRTDIHCALLLASLLIACPSFVFGQSNSSGRRIETQTPSTSGPISNRSSPPKPRQPGTQNARHMGNSMVRCAQGGPWYHANGTVFSEGELNFEVFDYPGANPNEITDILPRLLPSDPSIKIDILIQEHAPGRLIVLSEFSKGQPNSGSLLQTFNLQTMDLDRAVLRDGYIRVPCSRSASCVYSFHMVGDDYRNLRFTAVAELPVGGGEEGFGKSLAALRDLAALFPNKTPPIPREDASCACWELR